GQADLIVGNNVLAHVPDLRDFVEGMRVLLAPQGVITVEFPHLMRLVEGNQFDTIYHEHFSYFSFRTARRAFRQANLEVFDVEELPTHGGSLRVYARHAGADGPPIASRVEELLERERAAGYDDLRFYGEFRARVEAVKRDLLAFLIDVRRQGRRVVGYGAAAKGNTLLNYCGVRGDFLDYVVDRNPHKQGRYLPGTHLPILAPEAIDETRPEYVLILPWNLRDEIVRQMDRIREWGGKFVVAIPRLEVLS
ncbi:MAG TPA: class I SAM-dependent methyltransferase, partial [Vicinamibacterales bacterium]